MAKWHGRYYKEKSAWWRQIMCEKSNSEDAALVPLQLKDAIGRSMWFEILKANVDFFDFVTIQVKNGSSIRFWYDWWMEKNALKDKYPRRPDFTN